MAMKLKKFLNLHKVKAAEAVIDFVGEKGSTQMGLAMTSGGGFIILLAMVRKLKS